VYQVSFTYTLIPLLFAVAIKDIPDTTSPNARA
jgi:hypothetical protein